MSKRGKPFISALTSMLVGLFLLNLLVARPRRAEAIPAFARKYGLPCSACHEAWPKLNNFGITFKDNGYQLMNDRDSPIWHRPEYIPLTFRITPNWHREWNNRLANDVVPGVAASGLTESPYAMSGYDLSGLDILNGGTLYKNISFLLTPSSDPTATFHFESAWVRFDNILGSHWLNFKFGKHELDMPESLSEKRIMALSNNGGFYRLYHFVAPGSSNDFGIGDNQLGMEVSGHSRNSYTRYAFDVMSSNEGNVLLPSGNTYDVYAHFSQAFQLPKLGLQRVGVLAVSGRRPTDFLTAGGAPIPGTGFATAPFYRFGAYGAWYAGKFDLSTMYMRGSDNVYLATGTPANFGPGALPAGAKSPVWNGGIFELHYTHNPQLILIGRYELIRMAQATYPAGFPLPTGPFNPDTGNTNVTTVGVRYYPIMFSRAGLAWHTEYSNAQIVGGSPVSGRNANSSSIFTGLDFDF